MEFHAETMNNHANLRIAMKVFRGQEANLEWSRIFYRGNKSALKAGAKFSKIQAPKSVKFHEHLLKPLNIHENL